MCFESLLLNERVLELPLKHLPNNSSTYFIIRSLYYTFLLFIFSVIKSFIHLFIQIKRKYFLFVTITFENW